MTDIGLIISQEKPQDRYVRQLERIKKSNQSTNSIELAVTATMRNIESKCKSFVIYGEPQSGKTELMIALTARLLDSQFRIIVVLVNDNVQLFKQNLDRFLRSGIDPAPRSFAELLDPEINISNSEWIVFSKKNPKDLKKLLDKLGHQNSIVVIDDEADYASPNSKVNRGEKTKINELVEKLIGKSGIYIGVTATPARLDLNNTFMNANQHWVSFPPHSSYHGQLVFFPTKLSDPLQYYLAVLPDEGDKPEFLRTALMRFMVKVAYLNLFVHPGTEQYYSILIHTSGKRVDHSDDFKEVNRYFEILRDTRHKKCKDYYQKINDLSEKMFPGCGMKIVEFIYNSNRRNKVIVMNSNTDKNNIDYSDATNPCALYTVAIGGNIVSRGVTFNKLLSMFFTRDAKHKIQQDTYIQRARMFGTRKEHLKYMELHIPERLYVDWHRCFVFHRLSVEAIGIGICPVWIEDSRVKAASTSSVDKTTVSFDSGEMSFEIFEYTDAIEQVIEGGTSTISRLAELSKLLPGSKLPRYLLQFIEHFSPNGQNSLAIHGTGSVTGWKDANQEGISRPKGFIGKNELELDRYPDAVHHIKLFKNSKNKARVFYKYVGNVKFIKNLRNQPD